MIGNGRLRRHECVVVDLNTQRDFCHPAGLSPVANVHDLIPALRHIVAWTKRNGAPVVSSIESHRESDFTELRQPFGCLDGSVGQRKIDFTVFRPCTYVEVDNMLCCPIDLFNQFQQVIFCKRSCDLLSNPKADRFFNVVSTGEFILFGVAMEESVKALALGLMARNKRVSIVVDACGYWHKPTADLTVRQLSAKGARMLTVADLLQRKLQRRFRYTTPRGSGMIERPVPSQHGAGSRNGRGHGNGHLRTAPPTPKPLNEQTGRS